MTARLESHDGPEPEFGAGLVGEGRDTVEHDAGPHPVCACRRPGDEAGGVRDAALAGKARGRRREPAICAARSPACSVRSASARWVASANGCATNSAGAEPRGRRRDVCGREAEAMHAAVDFQPDAEDMRAVPGFEQRELPVLVHEGLEARGARQPRARSASRTPSSSTMRERAARLAQRHRFFDPRNGETRRRRQRLRDRNEAMAVGIRLDDGEDAASGSVARGPAKGCAGAPPCR